MAANLAYGYQQALDFDAPADHFQLLHAKQLGSVLVWEKATSGNAWHKINPEQTQEQIRTFLAGLTGGEDTYFSVNEFHGWRLQRLLKSLRACFVDIDLDRPADRFDLDAALDTLAAKQLPMPSLAVFSGRGLHLYWITTPTPAQALPVWQAVEKVLINALAELGADRKARDCTRVLRLAGTINSKNSAEVRGLVLDGQPYTFHHLANEVLGYQEATTGKKAKVKSFDAAKIRKGDHPKATIYRRWHLVLADLHMMGCHHRQIPDGNRNEFLFIGSVALSWFAAPESISDEVADLARLYCPGISDEEARKAASQSIQRATKAAGGETKLWAGQEVDPRYRFKRTTLWERLEDLAKPLKHKLRAIIPDDVAAEREQERQKGRDRVAEGRYATSYTGAGVRAGNEQKRATARLLAAHGQSQRAIAAELGVSHVSVGKWLRGGN